MNAAASPASRLEIEVADFGPLVHAKVDLRPMTVFIGPSNTGKSYLAILLYALHRFFGGDSRGFWGIGRFAASLVGGLSSDHPSDLAVVAFRELEQAISEAGTGRGDGTIVLPASVVELARSELNGLGTGLIYEIMRCFGMDEPADLVRKSQRAHARVRILHRGLYDAMPLEQTLEFGSRKAEFRAAIPERISVAGSSLDYALRAVRQVRAGLSRASASDFRAFEYIDAAAQLLTEIVPLMIGDFRLPAYYFPADRTGVMHAHSAVVSAMIGNAPLAGLQPSERTPMLSGVLADFLRQLIEMDRIPRRRPLGGRRRDRQVAASVEMENTILQGSVRVERSELINYPHFVYRPDGWKDDLPLMNASSMVSEIAPLVLYLRHIVEPGNVLIIEEPESHLHPAMQVEFTRQLAKLVQRGYRVIITTHSEWVLEELGNVVQRSRLPDKARATIPNGEVALSDDQVGVWLFRPKPRGRARGSEVARVSLGETGLYDAGFDDVAIALSNDGARIFERTGGNK